MIHVRVLLSSQQPTFQQFASKSSDLSAAWSESSSDILKCSLLKWLSDHPIKVGDTPSSRRHTHTCAQTGKGQFSKVQSDARTDAYMTQGGISAITQTSLDLEVHGGWYFSFVTKHQVLGLPRKSCNNSLLKWHVLTCLQGNLSYCEVIWSSLVPSQPSQFLM